MDAAFNIIRKCNKGCDFCYLDLTGESLPLEKILEVLDAVNAGTITLTGGEPLVHPEIKDILRVISSRGHHIHLLTNGILLNEDYIPEIQKAQAELFVTYNEPDGQISHNLHLAHESGIEINLHHVLTYQSVGHLEEICKDFDFIKSILLLYPTNVTKGNVVMYSPEEWFPLLEQALQVLKKYGITAYYEQAFTRKDSPLADAMPCPAGKDLFIDANGRAYPCCLLVDVVIGEETLIPRKMTPNECHFIKSNPLPPDSQYVRLCPISITETQDGSFQFPSHIGDS